MSTTTAASVPYVKSGNFKVPQIGLGCMMWDQMDKEGEVCSIVKDAVDLGYRHFDNAALYLTEKDVGRAIKEKIAEGVVKRDDIFIVSKLPMYAHRPENIQKVLDKSLQDLGVDYIDLYLLHSPFACEATFELDRECSKEDFLANLRDENKAWYNDSDFVTTWKHLEQFVDEGIVKALGVSNFNSKQLHRLLDNCRIKPVNHQIESHPHLTNERMVNFCQSRGITVTAFHTMGGHHKKYKKGEDDGAEIPPLLQREEVNSIAKKHNKTAAQVLQRYQIERNVIIIPRSSKKERLKENLSIFDFSLDRDDMTLLNSLNQDLRFLDLSWARKHPEYPFNEPF